MEYMNLAIVTDEAPYGRALSRSILIGNQNAEVSIFGCEAFCLQWKAGGEKFRSGFDLVLWDWRGLEKVYGGNIVWLTERREPSAENRYKIYKYADSAEMTARIFEIYQRLTGRKPAGPRPASVEVTAFASWQGGCGCTTLAFAAGQELAQTYRRRVLYISLEGFESTGEYIDGQGSVRTPGEYLYHLFCQSPKGTPTAAGTFLEEYLIRDAYGIAAFAPATGRNPLADLSGEDMGRLLPALMGSGQFDGILLDIGDSCSEAAREALQYANRICLVSVRNEGERESKYRDFLQYGVSIDEPERIISVRNRCLKPEDGVICISERTAGDRRLLLEDSFGRDIHNLVQLW